MFHIVLFEPKIPPNTGNIIRLCANTGCSLHLIEPLGFNLEEKALRRAGLDYHEFASVKTYPNWQSLVAISGTDRMFTLSTHNKIRYSDGTFKPSDWIVFGSETHGLPTEFRNSPSESQRLTLPMCEGNRSLNLSNSAAIVIYEAWRQIDFAGCATL